MTTKETLLTLLVFLFILACFALGANVETLNQFLYY